MVERIRRSFALLAPVAIMSGVVGGVAFAALGMWLIAWAMVRVSGVFERQPGRGTTVPPSAVASGPEKRTAERVIIAGAEDASEAKQVLEIPRARLEEPPPIADVRALEHLAPPRCADIFVYAVSISPSFPEYSAASIAPGADSRGRFRQIGQSIGDWEVSAIIDDWSGLNPEVWLSRDELLCRAELAGNSKRNRPPSKARAKKRARKGRRSK